MTDNKGWQWFETATAAENAAGDVSEESSLAIAFARCFSTGEGRRVLQHLRSCTLERTLGPSVTDAHLRHLEGQRQLVAQVLMLIAQGEQGV